MASLLTSRQRRVPLFLVPIGVFWFRSLPALSCGIAFRPSESKKKQEHRRRAMAHIGSWAEKRAIKLTAQAMAQVIDGFGASKSGEDAFDALAGLLSIIEVVEGRRPEWGFLPPKRHHSMGGWILGQS